MSQVLGLMIESLVAVLLILTIFYCALLNKRLTRLRADEQSLKATISELITATEIAERAIAGLKITIRECDHDLGERIARAETLSTALLRQTDAGEVVLSRITRIATAAARPSDGEMTLQSSGAPAAQSLAIAAQAFVERSRLRVNGVAA